MKFLSLVIALLIEQARPLRQGNFGYAAFRRYADVLEHYFNGGAYRHGILAWGLAIVPPALAAGVVSGLVYRVSPLLALAWNILVLYLTMGFRQFSHYYSDVLQSLREGDVAVARERLRTWRGPGAGEIAAGDAARVSIELGLVASHRHVFGPIVWFVVFGPAGAVIYRVAAMLNDAWGKRGDAEFGDFGLFARRSFFWLDWLPVRVTAASFAIVGNFEDAVYCWRTQARSVFAKAREVILATGGGALGVRLGDAVQAYDGTEFRDDFGIGDEADVDYMQSAVGLIWRALVLWAFLIFIVTIAHTL